MTASQEESRQNETWEEEKAEESPENEKTTDGSCETQDQESGKEDVNKAADQKDASEKTDGNAADGKNEKVQELTDRLQRLMAEFDNYRKRTEKEKATTYDAGISKVLTQLLPVVDNFERGLQAVPEAERTSSTYTGMDMIYKQLMKLLTDMGVTPIEAVGKPFDPNFHHAVMQVENEELEPDTVAQELQKGYLYKGSVLRCSMVSVVQES